MVKSASSTPAETAKLTLNRNALFDGLTGTSYATYDGEHTVGTYTVTTKDVLGNKDNTLDVLQFKKNSGTLSVTGTFKKIRIVVESTYPYSDSNKLTITVGGTALSYDASAINSAREDSGLKSGDKTVYYYVIELEFTEAEAEVVVKKDTKNATYVTSIELF